MPKRQETSKRAGWSEGRRRHEMEKAGARTSVVGCGLPRAEADAFREACRKQGRSCNAVLGDFCRAFTAAASAPGVPLRVQVLPDVGGGSDPLGASSGGAGGAVPASDGSGLPGASAPGAAAAEQPPEKSE